MTRVLVVTTGGTIGSTTTDGIIDVVQNSASPLIDSYNKYYNGLVDFDVISPLNILSENMTPESLCILLSAISNVNTSIYDGVVVTHGTDTLSFTAPYMGMLFGHYDIPIILTASNKPIDEDGSNGIDNFNTSVEIIRNKWRRRGVFVVYKNPSEPSTSVYLATRIKGADLVTGMYSDLMGYPFGRVIDGFYINKENFGLAIILDTHTKNNLVVPKHFDNEVAILPSYVGLNYTDFGFNGGVKAVIIPTFHSGTINTTASIYGVGHLIDKCRKQGIAIYLLADDDSEDTHYASKDTLYGVHYLGKMTLEAAHAKLCLLYNQPEPLSDDKIFDIVKYQNIYYEAHNKYLIK